MKNKEKKSKTSILILGGAEVEKKIAAEIFDVSVSIKGYREAEKELKNFSPDVFLAAYKGTASDRRSLSGFVDKLPDDSQILLVVEPIKIATLEELIENVFFDYVSKDDDYEIRLRTGLKKALKLKETLTKKRKLNDLLNKVIDIAPDPFFVKDEEHNMVFVNEALAKIVDEAKSNIIGKNDYDYVPKEEADVFWEIDSRVLETGEDNENLETLTDASGTIRTIRTKKTRYTDPSTGENYLVGVIRDETERFSLKDELEGYRDHLEVLVEERTKELAQTNKALEKEIAAAAAAREKLSESRAMLQLIIDSIPQYVFWKDVDSVYLGCNDNFARAAGLKDPLEIVGKTDFDLTWKDSEAEEYRMWDKKIIDSGKAQYHIIETQKQPDGSTLHIDTCKIPLKNKHGEIVGLLGSYEDITDRLKYEAELKRINENLTVTLQSIGDAVIVTDEESFITKMNPVAEQLTGYNSKEAFGKPLDKVFDIYNSVTREKAKNPVVRALKEGKIVGLANHTLLVSKNGEEYQIADSASPIRKEDGEVIGCIMVFRDVTEDYRKDKALRRSEEKYRILFEQSVDPALILKDGLFVDCNSAAVEILGYDSKDEVVGKHPALLSPVEQPDGKNSFEKAADIIKKAKIDGHQRFEWIHKRKDGKRFPVEVTLTQIPYDDEYILHTAWRDITARKIAEKALAESEEKFRLTFQAAPVAISVTKLDTGEFIDVNESFVKLIGRESRDELIGKTSKEIDMWVEDGDREKMIKILEEGKYSVSGFEGVIKNQAGDIKNVIYSLELIEIAGETCLLAAQIDDTERKRAKNELKISEERLSLALEAANDGMFDHDLENDVMYFSPRWFTMLGFSPDEFTQTFDTWVELLHPDDRKDNLDKVQKYVQMRYKSFVLEFRMKSASGGYRWILSKSKVVETAEDGSPIRIVGTHTDITDRKRFEHALRQSEKKYRQMFELSPEAIVLIDKSGKIVDANKRVTDWIGYLPEELIGKTIPELDFVSAEQKKFLLEQFNNKTRGFPAEPYETSFYDKSGAKMDAWLISTVLTDDAGEFMYDLVMISNITELKNAERAIKDLNRDLERRVEDRTARLADAYEELKFENEERKRTEEELKKARDRISGALEKEKELNEMKTRFISMISHEYRTPLQVILSATDVLTQVNKTGDDIFEKYVKNIRTSVKTMTQLLEDVLTLGKSEAGKLKMKKSSFNLIELCRNIIEDVRVYDKDMHEFVFAFDDDFLEIESDEKLVRQIVNNLVTNAAKYSPLSSAVKIEVIDAGSFVMISVIDSGLGIEEADLERLFDPFHRGKNVGAISGTGLGLSIVKRCVNELNGEIKVRSKVGEGSRFEVKLPVKKEV